MSNITKWFLLFAAIALFNSCKQQPTSPETATIQGRVLLSGPNYVLSPPYNGVLVSIEGTNFSALTDDSGYFSFQGIPTGTYNVSFLKAGYGGIVWYSQTITGGGNAPLLWYNSSQYTPIMYKVSNVITTLQQVRFKDTDITVWGQGNSMFLLSEGNVTPDPLTSQYDYGMAVYVSHTPDVSGAPGHYTTFVNVSEWNSPWNFPIDTTAETFLFAIPIYNLTIAGFNSGDSIYVAAYGAQAYDAGDRDYYDPAIQQYVLTTLNPTPSPVIGTKMP